MSAQAHSRDDDRPPTVVFGAPTGTLDRLALIGDWTKNVVDGPVTYWQSGFDWSVATDYHHADRFYDKAARGYIDGARVAWGRVADVAEVAEHLYRLDIVADPTIIDEFA